jgi:hypothetical protein
MNNPFEDLRRAYAEFDLAVANTREFKALLRLATALNCACTAAADLAVKLCSANEAGRLRHG